MLLDVFLAKKLNVQFERRFNSLAVKEILYNKDEYPLIAEKIMDMVKYKEDEEFNHGSVLGYDRNFDFDISFDEIMELYRAFLKVFLESLKEKDFELFDVTIGEYYLSKPDPQLIMNRDLNCEGSESISVSKSIREFSSKVFWPLRVNDQVTGYEQEKETRERFYVDNKELLNTLKKNLKSLNFKDDVLRAYFPGFKGYENATFYCYEHQGYGYTEYKFSCDFGDCNWNTIKLFTGSLRDEPFYPIFKTPILNALTEKEKLKDAYIYVSL